MSNFDRAVEVILKHEGGFVHHSRDPGGATNYGITQRVAREHGYTGDMRDLPLATAKDIYRKSYWHPRYDEMPYEVALNVFDAAVNSGQRRAVRWLQQAVGTTDDGLIGPKTMIAVQAVQPIELVKRFNAIRYKFLKSLHHFDTFGRGWTNRLIANLQASGINQTPDDLA